MPDTIPSLLADLREMGVTGLEAVQRLCDNPLLWMPQAQVAPADEHPVMRDMKQAIRDLLLALRRERKMTRLAVGDGIPVTISLARSQLLFDERLADLAERAKAKHTHREMSNEC